jgi:hypothetical protein
MYVCCIVGCILRVPNWGVYLGVCFGGLFWGSKIGGSQNRVFQPVPNELFIKVWGWVPIWGGGSHFGVYLGVCISPPILGVYILGVYFGWYSDAQNSQSVVLVSFGFIDWWVWWVGWVGVGGWVGGWVGGVGGVGGLGSQGGGWNSGVPWVLMGFWGF